MNPIQFSQILGNEEIKKRLRYVISKKAVGHAFLFAGPEGVGKSLFARAFAAALMTEENQNPTHVHKIQLGQHPDLHIYHPEGKLGLHSIQSLRQLGEEVHLPPYEAPWKVFIIHSADRMLSYSAHALLKTFEEPPPRTLIILLSHSPAKLLPTLLSRCSTFHFHSLSSSLIQEYLKQHYSLEEKMLVKIAQQAQGSLGRAVRLIEQKGDDGRTYLLNLLAQSPFAHYKALQESAQYLSDRVETVKKHIEGAAREELNKIYSEYISVHQQQTIEKELEGLVAITLIQEAGALFEYILSWYRDMQLLLLGGSSIFLCNPDFEMEIQQAVQRGAMKPLQEVHHAIEEAYSALQNSTPLSLCLENLFLKLEL